MTQVWRSSPQIQVTVTHSSTNYELDATSTQVIRHENGFDTATVVLEDTGAKNYVDKVAADDTIKVEQRDASESWVTIFDGVIRRVIPMLSMQGNLLKLKCDGAGYGLGVMFCGEEYGTESSNSSLDTIREIVKDASNGIIPLWVNKLLGTATDTGHSYTTYIEAITGSIKYLYFPYKPSAKAINDVCDVVQAIKGTNAGPHWIVDTNDRFLLTTVGSHSAAGDNPAQYWSTWWRTDADGSTLVEGEDFANFKFQELAKEANYVLYHGPVIKPLDLDKWTEDNAAEWEDDGFCAVASVAGGKVGEAIRLTSENFGGVLDFAYARYPDTDDLDLNITNMGGSYSIPIFHCWAKIDANVHAHDGWFMFKFRDSTDDSFGIGVTAGSTVMFPVANQWTELTIPIGPNWMKATSGIPQWFEEPFIGVMTPDWSDIQQIGVQFTFTANGWQVWVDNFYISGSVIRGARPSAAYSSTNTCRMKIVTDDVAKDDSCNATDDSGTIGRLAYAELLRCQTTPIVGTFTIPIANDLLPGQQIHIHAKKKVSKLGVKTYRIDKNFRVMRLVHSITDQGFTTTVDVTDDLKNANPRPIPDQMNVVLRAVRPEFQDRQASSIKARGIDVTQPILEKSY